MLDFEDNDDYLYNQSVANHIPQKHYTPFPYTKPHEHINTYRPVNNYSDLYYEHLDTTGYNFFGNLFNNVTCSHDDTKKIIDQIVESLKKYTGHEYKFSCLPSNEFIDFLQSENNSCATLMCPQIAPGCNESDYLDGPNILIDIQKSNMCVIDFEVNHELDTNFTVLLEELTKELQENIEHEKKVLQKLEEQGINDNDSDSQSNELFNQNVYVDQNLFESKLPDGYNSSYLTLEEYNVISREEYEGNTVSFNDESKICSSKPKYSDKNGNVSKQTYFSLSNIFSFSVLSNLY